MLEFKNEKTTRSGGSFIYVVSLRIGTLHQGQYQNQDHH